MKEMMKEMIGSDPEIRSALGKSVLKRALSGDMTALKIVWSYMDGMPPQAVDVTSGGEKIEGFILEFINKDEAKDKDSK